MPDSRYSTPDVSGVLAKRDSGSKDPTYPGECRGVHPRNSESSTQRSSQPCSCRLRAGEVTQCPFIRDEHADALLEELMEVLDAELDQYRDILRLLHVQREFFAAGDVSSFEEASKKQGTVILKVKTLEEARKFIVSRLAQHFDIPYDGFTLAELAKLVDGQYSERCVAYQKEILSLVKELGTFRESNAYLIQQSLHYVSGVLRIFASAHSIGGRLEHEAER